MKRIAFGTLITLILSVSIAAAPKSTGRAMPKSIESVATLADANSPDVQSFEAKIAATRIRGNDVPVDLPGSPAVIRIGADPNDSSRFTAHLLTRKNMRGLAGGRITNLANGESMSLPTYEFDTTGSPDLLVAVLQRLWDGTMPWGGLTLIEGFIASEQIGFTVIRRLINPYRGAVDELPFAIGESSLDFVEIKGRFGPNVQVFLDWIGVDVVVTSPEAIYVRSPFFIGAYDQQITICDNGICGDRSFEPILPAPGMPATP